MGVTRPSYPGLKCSKVSSNSQELGQVVLFGCQFEDDKLMICPVLLLTTVLPPAKTNS